MRTANGYQKDLAFIHDDGFSGFSLEAAAGLLAIFKKHSLFKAHVVELGCGSGRLARMLLQRDFTVTAVDSSPAMIALARHNAPGGRFSVASIWDYDIPTCDAVISIGEVLNYQFDGRVSASRLRRLFSRAYESLHPSGLFVFDILCMRASTDIIRTKSFTESDRWLVAVEKTDSPESVTRRIIAFRRCDGIYRKSIEVHKAYRYNLDRVLSEMRRIGFKVSTRSGYRKNPLGRGHTVVLGRKPSA